MPIAQVDASDRNGTRRSEKPMNGAKKSLLFNLSNIFGKVHLIILLGVMGGLMIMEGLVPPMILDLRVSLIFALTPIFMLISNNILRSTSMSVLPSLLPLRILGGNVLIHRQIRFSSYAERPEALRDLCAVSEECIPINDASPTQHVTRQLGYDTSL